MLKIDVYHGTTKENARSIVENKEFRINDDKNDKLYLGAGIYFFEEKIHAVTWNIHLFRKNKIGNLAFKALLEGYSVIRARLNIIDDNILDLDDLNDNRVLDILALKVKEKFGVQINNNYVAYINFLQRNELIPNICVMKKNFTYKIRNNTWGRLKSISRAVYCVKDKSIISNIEELEITKKEFDSAVYYA